MERPETTEPYQLQANGGIATPSRDSAIIARMPETAPFVEDRFQSAPFHTLRGILSHACTYLGQHLFTFAHSTNNSSFLSGESS
jgi:hypothetical protein